MGFDGEGCVERGDVEDAVVAGALDEAEFFVLRDVAADGARGRGGADEDGEGEVVPNYSGGHASVQCGRVLAPKVTWSQADTREDLEIILVRVFRASRIANPGVGRIIEEIARGIVEVVDGPDGAQRWEFAFGKVGSKVLLEACIGFIEKWTSC